MCIRDRDKAEMNDSKLHDFLGTILGGHAAITGDTPGLEGKGFEVWRLLHQQYSPQGATYETDMLQGLMSQTPARDMNTLADSVVKFEYEWRKYEQETHDRLTDKFKASCLLKMFPNNAHTDKSEWKFQQDTVT